VQSYVESPLGPVKEEQIRVEVDFDITKHELVPEHILLSEEDKNKILKEYNVSLKQMPSILQSDPGIKHLDAKPGDMIMVKRKSPTAGEAPYYRVVVHG